MVCKVGAKELYRRSNFIGNPRHLVINGAGHVKGRLSSIVAKQLLQGRPVTVLRCERIVQSGTLTKNLHRWGRFLRLWGNSNPRIRSHQHRKAPSMMFFRNVRASFKHKTNAGLNALCRFRCYDGVPKSYAKEPMYKATPALAHKIYKPQRKCCTLGDLAVAVGWKHSEAVAVQDAARIVASNANREEQKAIKDKLVSLNDQAKKNVLSP